MQSEIARRGDNPNTGQQQQANNIRRPCVGDFHGVKTSQQIT